MNIPRLNILIVEDDRLIASVIKLQVKKLGHKSVGVVSSGEDAIEESISKKPDVVLMDINLDGPLNGIEAADIINKKINTRVIFISGEDESRLLKIYKNLTPNNYLAKPITSEPLARNISFAIQKS